MKSKFNFLIVLFTFAFFLTGAGAEETKEYNESWPASEVQSLSISNKFGEVRINNNGGSEVTVDVLITVNASTQVKAKQMLEQIKVDFRKSGGSVRAVTSIDDDFRGQKEFSIDYTVNIPSDKNLEISNKFGNTFVNKLNANGSFSIEHGDFNALTLNGKNVDDMKIDLAFGKATVDGLTFGKLDIKHSTVFIGESTDLIINSSHSVFNIEEANSVEADSKFDSFSFEEVGEFRGLAQHTNLKIEELGKILKVESGYGAISAEEVKNDFELIDVKNKFGSIKLGISESVSYDLKAKCTHCDIDLGSEFKGNRMSDNFTKELEGKVGSGTSTAKVTVVSEFGGIKLR
ncbi:MAG: hypothetical protein JW833_14760 [Prolixibacteraceae bacterium]|nr:hypothetical protein [Prolixibacteraceae bacterium]